MTAAVSESQSYAGVDRLAVRDYLAVMAIGVGILVCAGSIAGLADGEGRLWLVILTGPLLLPDYAVAVATVVVTLGATMVVGSRQRHGWSGNSRRTYLAWVALFPIACYGGMRAVGAINDLYSLPLIGLAAAGVFVTLLLVARAATSPSAAPWAEVVCVPLAVAGAPVIAFGVLALAASIARPDSGLAELAFVAGMLLYTLLAVVAYAVATGRHLTRMSKQSEHGVTPPVGTEN